LLYRVLILLSRRDPVAAISTVDLPYNPSMDPARDLGRILILLGAILALAGAFLYFGAKLPFRLGRLPGDIIHRGEHTTFYFPIVTCLILSLGLSLLFWLFGHLRK
jgi:hypothetical protein